MGLQALIVIGGDGSLSIAHQFYLKGIPVVGVPKTIDNDIVGTTSCFGFDTAVAFAADAIDRLHSTAEAHKRIMVVEVMGRYAGWIALQGGIAGGADVILLPEIPYHAEKVAAAIRRRESFGAKFSIVVAAEGAKPVGGAVTVRAAARAGYVERLGGIGIVLAEQFEDMTGREARCRARAPATRRRTDRVRSCPRDQVRRGGRELIQHAATSERWWRTIRRTSCRSRLRMSLAGPRRCRSIPI